MNIEKTYRPNVGVALFNKDGLVLVCKRDGKNDVLARDKHWQMPQGGIDGDETPLEAAYREIKEETNIEPSSMEFLKQALQAYRYDYPEKHFRRYKGQEQTWVALMFTGNDSEIDVINCPDRCFSAWRWERLENTPDLVVDFKKPSYEGAVKAFRSITVE